MSYLNAWGDKDTLQSIGIWINDTTNAPGEYTSIPVANLITAPLPDSSTIAVSADADWINGKFKAAVGLEDDSTEYFPLDLLFTKSGSPRFPDLSIDYRATHVPAF